MSKELQEVKFNAVSDSRSWTMYIHDIEPRRFFDLRFLEHVVLARAYLRCTARQIFSFEFQKPAIEDVCRTVGHTRLYHRKEAESVNGNFDEQDEPHEGTAGELLIKVRVVIVHRNEE